jgi:small multidrug resistance family-3 protein
MLESYYAQRSIRRGPCLDAGSTTPAELSLAGILSTSMTRSKVVFLLFTAAVLEAGGDALIRAALHRAGGAMRWFFFLAGSVTLFTYGIVVNRPPWDFGRLLGAYVVLFFLLAQIISWLAFDQPPSRTTLIGGGFIVAGGWIVASGSGG